MGSVLGACLGHSVGSLYVQECLAFTTGGFMYFSINGIMSELKEVDGLGQTIMCTLSSIFGLYFMYVFALFE